MVTDHFDFVKLQLTQTAEQIKFRYKKIRNKESRNARNALINISTSRISSSNQVRARKYKVASRVPNSEKIERIAAALNNATQREYFDNSFFENLPEKVKFKQANTV